jgi:hypothetical protein
MTSASGRSCLNEGVSQNYHRASMAKWIRRLPTEQEIVGSIPTGREYLLFFLDTYCGRVESCSFDEVGDDGGLQHNVRHS